MYKFTISILNEYKGYFEYTNNTAIGCFLSHYNVWNICSQHANDHEWFLILEDDVYVPNIINMNVKLKKDRWTKQLNLINLNYRGDDGAEAYMLRPPAARKLIEICNRTIDQPVDKFLFREAIKNHQIIYSEQPRIKLDDKFSLQTTLKNLNYLTNTSQDVHKV